MGTPQDQNNESDYPSWNWQEKDWQRYLQITDDQVLHFCSLYHIFIDDPNRLDKAAARMGWMQETWAAGEVNEDEATDAEELPYTMHLHPVYTVTRAVFRSLYELCLAYANINHQNALHQISLQGVLHEAEAQALMGIESQDMGDMRLTVCHFKRSLWFLNQAMAILARMQAEEIPGADLFAREANKRIFDLRELWLRVNSEVREEIQRRGEGEE